jgi:triosephosphate isomerase
MRRKKMVAANWKMNPELPEAQSLVDEITRGMSFEVSCDVVIAPPFTHIPMLTSRIGDSGILTAAQHCHFESSGAFTGEISVGILRSLGVQFIIAGHSERRLLFDESNEIVRLKVDAILNGGLVPIFCCGERLEIRQEGKQNEFVKAQLEDCILHLDVDRFQHLVIAYEPVWAIGTGMTATPEQAQEMHEWIRNIISGVFGEKTGQQTRILYGGSIKADNAIALFSQRDVDGGLVGGASLDAAGFINIIRAACG